MEVQVNLDLIELDSRLQRHSISLTNALSHYVPFILQYSYRNLFMLESLEAVAEI